MDGVAASCPARAAKASMGRARVPIQNVLGSLALCGRYNNVRHMRCVRWANQPVCRDFCFSSPSSLVATARYVV